MRDKPTYYRKILRQAKGYDFLTPAELTINQFADLDSTFLNTTALVTAPSITAFVIWVLFDALNNNINTLYFLARDGLVMYKIACKICSSWGLGIKCKYLYLSRISLRAPIYAIDKNYAIEKMCQYLFFGTTLAEVLSRAGLSDEESEKISMKLGENMYSRLTKFELTDIAIKLKNCKEFDELAMNKALNSIDSVKGYLNQEIPVQEKNILLNDTPIRSTCINNSFALVDTGWEGSVHKCISILRNESITGYYFGMNKTGDPDYGEYKCFLFNGDKQFRKYRWFCINLFECMCAANHGTTIGYKQDEGKWIPVLGEMEKIKDQTMWSATTQIDICEQYVSCFTNVNKQILLMFNKIHKKLLKSFMMHPSQEEARVYGAIPFSHISTAETYTLTAQLTPQLIKQNSLSFRVLMALSGNRKKILPEKPNYWPEGTIQLSDANIFRRIDMWLLHVSYRFAQNLLFWKK